MRWIPHHVIIAILILSLPVQAQILDKDPTAIEPEVEEPTGLVLPVIEIDSVVTGTFAEDDLVLEALLVDAVGDTSYADAFELTLGERETISIEVTGTVPIYLALIGPDGEPIAGAGTTGDDNAPSLLYTTPEGGQYRLVVNSFHGDPGEYELNVAYGSDEQLQSASDNMPVDGVLLSGEPVDGNIDPAARLYRTFMIDVPAAAEQLTLETAASQDIDLFVRYGMQILHTYAEADYEASTRSGDEIIRINAVSAPPLREGRYYIDVVAFVPGAEQGAAAARPFQITATLVESSMPTVEEQRPADSGELVTGSVGPNLRSGELVSARIDPEVGAVQIWPILVPPGSERLEVRTYNATGRLDAVMTPPGVNLPPSTWDFFTVPYRTITARDNERLVIDAQSDPPLRSGLYQIAIFDLYSVGHSDYEIVASVDEVLAPWPDYEIEDDLEDYEPLERAKLSTVQLSLSMDEGGASLGSGTILTASGLILTNHRIIGTCDVGDDSEYGCSGDVHRYPDGRPVTVYVALTSETQGTATQYYTARVIQSRPDVDLALLEIVADLDGRPLTTELPYLPIAGGASPLVVGQPVTAVGFPSMGGGGGRVSVATSSGVVAGFVEEEQQPVLINISGDINATFSGGALVNEAGQLVGIPSTARVRYDVGERHAYARGVELLPTEWVEMLTSRGAEFQ